MSKRGFPPPLKFEVGPLLVTVYFDGPHPGKCATCGKDARCGLSYGPHNEAIPPDAVYVEGGAEPWVFHLDCIAAAEGDAR